MKDLLAKESDKIERARKKLRKKLELIDDAINQSALERKSVEIHRWIARNSKGRVVLKKKTISLFDENKNAVGFSNRISKLASDLKSDTR